MRSIFIQSACRLHQVLPEPNALLMDQELCNVSNLRFKDVLVSMALLTLDHLQCGEALGSSSMWRISSRSSGQKSLVHHVMLECFPRNMWKPQVQTEVIFSTHPQVETLKHVNVVLPCKSQKHIHYKEIKISLPNPRLQKRMGLITYNYIF